MENVKRDLEKFKDWYNDFHKNDSIELITSIEIDMFLKSRPREPEALNSNEQTKEFKKLVYCKDIPDKICSMISCDDCEAYKC